MSSIADDHEIAFLAYYEPSHKIWGWLAPRHRNDRRSNPWLSDTRRPMEIIAFWAVIGRTITVKRHLWRSNLNQVKTKKLAGKYVEMSTERLLELWPTFVEDMDQRLLFLRLSDGFEE